MKGVLNTSTFKLNEKIFKYGFYFFQTIHRCFMGMGFQSDY